MVLCLFKEESGPSTISSSATTLKRPQIGPMEASTAHTSPPNGNEDGRKIKKLKKKKERRQKREENVASADSDDEAQRARSGNEKFSIFRIIFLAINIGYFRNMFKNVGSPQILNRNVFNYLYCKREYLLSY